jgi:hypothetical protein
VVAIAGREHYLGHFGSRASRIEYERLVCEYLATGRRGTAEDAADEEITITQPITLRGLFYRVVSTGFLPSTGKEHYNRAGKLSPVKPSSWTGLSDFGQTVRDAYRKDFWHHLDDCVHTLRTVRKQLPYLRRVKHS